MGEVMEAPRGLSLILIAVLLSSLLAYVPALEASPARTIGMKYYYCGFEDDLGGFALQFVSEGASYEGPKIVGAFAKSGHCLFFKAQGSTASFRSPVFRMTLRELRVFRAVSFMLKAEVPPGGRIRVVVWIRGRSAAEQNLAFHVAGTSKELLRIEHSLGWRYFELDVWSAVRDWSGLEDEVEWYIEWYLDSPGQPVMVWLDDFAVKPKFQTGDPPIFYWCFESGLGDFAFQFATEGASYTGPTVDGGCLYFEVRSGTASFRTPIFRMTLDEMRTFRVAAFLLKADVPLGGRVRAVIWIRGKSAAEKGIAFHIAGTSRELLRIEQPTGWHYFQVDIWSAVKDWDKLEPENEWYIEWYLDSPGQPVRVWLYDFAVRPASETAGGPRAYGVLLEVSTTSDWTTVKLDGGRIAYYAWEVAEGASAPDLRIHVTPTSVHIGKKPFDRTPVKVKVFGYLVLTSGELKVTVEKGDIEATTVKIYAMWGDAEKLVWSFTNGGRVPGSNGINPRTGTCYFKHSLGQEIIIAQPASPEALGDYCECKVKLYYEDGTAETHVFILEHHETRRILVTRPVVQIDFAYTHYAVAEPLEGEWGAEPMSAIAYTVFPKHTSTIYLLAFPVWFERVMPEGDPHSEEGVVKAYSWRNYDVDNPPGSVWIAAPLKLEMMVGTEMAYVEEDAAGRVFTLFHGFAYEHVKDLLDQCGVEDWYTRYEIAATALWAAHLVKEVKAYEPDVDLCTEASKAIMKRYFGFNDFLINIALPLLRAYWYQVRQLDDATLYKAILAAIKFNPDYMKAFPEWRKIDEASWVEMCTRLSRYAVVYPTPTYAHALVASAYLIYTAEQAADAFAQYLADLISQALGGA